jgi:hypothetical protein
MAKQFDSLGCFFLSFPKLAERFGNAAFCLKLCFPIVNLFRARPLLRPEIAEIEDMGQPRNPDT